MKELLERVRACRLCEAALPLGPRPVLRASATARAIIISQAPSTKVHATGIPWNDASGQRLRAWLQLTPEQFYDESRIAIMPMGLCYPGRLPQGGDAPPRPECAPTWHPSVLAAMPGIRLTLLIGSYALTRYMGRGSMTDFVRRQPKAPGIWALPHPSWRNTGWLARNPWFEAEILPPLREALHGL
jgi:uracil-DNA glycosylase